MRGRVPTFGRIGDDIQAPGTQVMWHMEQDGLRWGQTEGCMMEGELEPREMEGQQSLVSKQWEAVPGRCPRVGG